jgi:hypothetical protein
MEINPHGHAPDEDPEQHIGADRPDPWDSDAPEDQDWPNEVIEVFPDAAHGVRTPPAARGVAHVEEV